MRTVLVRLGFSFFSSTLLVFAVACGGGQKPDAKHAGDDSSSGGEGPSSGGEGSGKDTAAASSGVGPATSSGGGTTTTTQLGDGGDLQGAKLGGKMHSETASTGPGGPKSTHGQSASEPGRTPKDLQAIVAARRDEARACYDKALPAHPGIEGDLVVKWVIDPEGNVSEASVDTTKSSILEPGVGSCIVDVIKKIKFAKSDKGYETRANYPFNFHPKKFQKDAGR